MSNVPSWERTPTHFDVVDTASKLYNKVLDICLKMPKRYTYLVLKDILTLAGEVADYTKKANSIQPNVNNPSPVDVNERRRLFMLAKASLEALSQRINFFVDRPEVLAHVQNGKLIGVTKSEINDLADLVIDEKKSLAGIIRSDAVRYVIL